MSTSQFFMVALLMICGVTHAQEKCKIIDNDNQAMEDGTCECGQKLEKYNDLQLKGYKLVAACFHESYPKEELHGTFYYSGNQLVEGQLKVNEIDAGMVFRHHNDYFYLYGDDVQLEKLWKGASKVPLCQEAPSATAKIRIQLFKRVTGDGGQAGDFPMKYEVIHVGKYSCK